MSQTISRFGEAFVSYGSYHNNPVNQWIHIVCVPIIAATLVCALSYIPLHFSYLGYSFGIDTLGIAIALAYYFSINLIFGFGMLLLSLALTVVWKLAFKDMEESAFFTWVIGIHILAWVLQFVGHGVFEKRKPALLDNITQILNAPLFVLVEVMDKMGLQSKEMEEWKVLIEKRVVQFREGQKSKGQ